ncbi:MAG: MFS transporter, partial [Streptosporangiaceae bacterium]
PAHAADAARQSLADAVAAARTLPADLASALLGPAREAFASGLHLVAGISAAVLAVVAVLMVGLLRGVPPTGIPPAGEAPAGEAPAERVAPAARGRDSADLAP